MKSKNNYNSISFSGNEFSRKHQGLSFRQSQGFSQWPILQKTLLELSGSCERIYVHGCGMTHPFCLDGPTFIMDSLSGGPAWHACVSIPFWRFFMRKHLFSGFQFYFIVTLKPMK